MMRRIEIERGFDFSKIAIPRRAAFDDEVLSAARTIVDDVRERGDAALREYTERFDSAKLEALRVSDAEIESALASVPDHVRDSLTAAALAIEDFAERQVPKSWFNSIEGGIFVGQKVTPLARVGIYVPGGRATYPSTVLMNAIPARVAGVEEIAMVVPCDADGTVPAVTLAAAVEAGVTEVYKVGGAQAIAALAYGTDSIPAVDKITGPGNAYVTAAKKLVAGDVGIDMLAGPSEVLVLADGTAPPDFIAIDLMAQAEHDPDAAVYLVTTDSELPDRVEESLRGLLADADRADIILQAIETNGLAVVCPDVEVALEVANAIAPEHLEVMMVDPLELLGSIRNAGAIFLGPWTPESVGDYVAGPNHTLPTGGTARYASPLSAADFVKTSSVISYSLEALEMDADSIVSIAEAEGLESHARAVTLRLGGVIDADGGVFLDSLEEFADLDDIDDEEEGA